MTLPKTCTIHGDTIDESWCCHVCEAEADAEDGGGDFGNSHLFVYGTLKRGNGNHRLLATAQFIGNAVSVAKNFTLSGLALSEHDRDFEGAPIKGELYVIPNDNVWRRLDLLEGHPRVWRRMVRPFVTEAGREFLAWVYIFQRRPAVREAVDPLNAEGQFEY